jgi:hypothetical protein
MKLRDAFAVTPTGTPLYNENGVTCLELVVSFDTHSSYQAILDVKDATTLDLIERHTYAQFSRCRDLALVSIEAIASIHGLPADGWSEIPVSLHLSHAR